VNRHSQPTLEGLWLTLRPVAERDLPGIVEWLRDPDVLYWWDNALDGVDAARRQFLDPSSEQPLWSFLIEEQGRGLGAIQCHHPYHGEDSEFTAGVDIFVAEAPARGRGVGTEAVRMMLQHLFEVLGVHRVTIDPEAGNARAIRAYEKAGFRFEGLLRDADHIRGGYVDTHFMAILADEWPQAKARWERERAADG